MGAHLAITGRDRGRTEDAAREIRAAGGGQVDVFVADLSLAGEDRGGVAAGGQPDAAVIPLAGGPVPCSPADGGDLCLAALASWRATCAAQAILAAGGTHCRPIRAIVRQNWGASPASQPASCPRTPGRPRGAGGA